MYYLLLGRDWLGRAPGFSEAGGLFMFTIEKMVIAQIADLVQAVVVDLAQQEDLELYEFGLIASVKYSHRNSHTSCVQASAQNAIRICTKVPKAFALGLCFPARVDLLHQGQVEGTCQYEWPCYEKACADGLQRTWRSDLACGNRAHHKTYTV